ncbi:UvrD-helicase domain-containing protein, partial [Oscillospiraceae bacterium OttesenSCG-928-G22]|nr:UvrD-helicase domain-containing protein [Oscillospiraceae bacterium OttesenSCG-928-G22]
MDDLNARFLKARDACMRLDYSHLNDKQQEAVFATEGPLLVLAGAGSGKTTVLISRIHQLIKYGRAGDSAEMPECIGEREVAFLEAYAKNPNEAEREAAERLCADRPAAPYSIIAITFTNKAAGEMKERLEALLGPPARDVWASTFHAASVRMLRRDIDRLGFTSSFAIYDSADSERLMKAVLGDLNLLDDTFTPKAVLRSISQAKDQMIWPDQYEKAYGEESSFKASRIAAAYAEYQKRLKAANALDFDDLILFAVTLLSTHDDIREYYQNKFRYVLIDEYQDTNFLQYSFAKLLAGKWKNLCVVGDDDQSIYRFRGATIENILSFESQNAKARVIKLEQNYRSTGTILKAANNVISNNLGRKGKNLWTSQGDGEPIVVYSAMSEAEEAQFIVEKILQDSEAGRPFRENAVLYRMNAQSNRIEDAFKRNGIPYRIVGGIRFFDRAEVKDLLAYLWVVRNKNDDLRLMRIINTPARGIGGKTVDTISELARQTGKPMLEILETAADYPSLARASTKLMSFAALIHNLGEKSRTLPLADFYDAVLLDTGYLRALEEKDDIESRGRIENILELKSNILAYEAEGEEATLDGFLDEVALFTDIQNYDPEADSVVLMTMHSAKGLEFPVV